MSPRGREGEGRHFSFFPLLPSPPLFLCPGEHLQICPQEYTCCSSEIEQRLTWETEATFQSLVEESGSFLVHMLSARHKTFDGENLRGVFHAGPTYPLCVFVTPSILSIFPAPSLKAEHPLPCYRPLSKVFSAPTLPRPCLPASYSGP